MRSVSQLLDQINLLLEENEELRKEIQKLRDNQPVYFDEAGWWFRKDVEAPK